MSEAGLIIISGLAGGGIITGLFEFIKFLIQHKTHKQEHKEDVDNKIKNLRTELKQHLSDTNFIWKEQYCDKNAQAIEELSKVSKDLKDNVVLLTGTMAEMREYNHLVGEAVNGVIHDRILHNVNGYINRGAITLEELSTLKSMYEPYRKLGGNGDFEVAYQEAQELPVITKEELIKRTSAK